MLVSFSTATTTNKCYLEPRNNMAPMNNLDREKVAHTYLIRVEIRK